MRKELTVSYRRQGGTSCLAPLWQERRRAEKVPFVRLSGKWLRRLGFRVGSKIEVEASPGCLVLRSLPAEPASEVAEPSAEGG